jgi:hypothetical protein
LSPQGAAVGDAQIFVTSLPQHDHSLKQVRTAVLLPPDAKPGDLPPAIVAVYPGLDATAGTRFHVSNASEARSCAATVGPKGALEHLKAFAERGGESVATDVTGCVYVANGQIFNYAANGDEIGRIDVPERPLHSSSAARIARRCSASLIARFTRWMLGGWRGNGG